MRSPGNTVRIHTVRIVPYALPFRSPFRTAHESIAERRGFTVHVTDAEGRIGIGESAPLAGFGMESLADCAAALHGWAAELTGARIPLPGFATPDLPSAMGTVVTEEHWPAALHGVECALVDLAAQAAGVSLARWLHPDAAAFVPLNATLGAAAPEDAARQARTWADQGFRAFKVKVGVEGLDADRARVQAVRDAVGAAAVLRVDANEAWSEDAAARALEALAPLGIEYCEQPVPAADLLALARLSAASPIPIAADEAAATERGATIVLRAHAARVLILKPMALGGPLATLRVARAAMAQGVPVVLTTMLEGSCGRTAALHTAAALPALAAGRVPTLACGLATGHLLARDLVPEPPQPADGALAVPTAPGLGLALG